ncbi:DUF4406 domain-containing protein [Acetobacterium malicum]|uniref:DUF4406 domain-containing protein n=1 Tax=Acetobacterium malicum TaxID=52692 RepID=A0ABR6Z196_9FIRM|nr:DUF4406 domain-containing protein [Acetobacterium malicum]MBC3901295.1 DUF4406 domain-containing protein [Acetobacterium malicum]
MDTLTLLVILIGVVTLMWIVASYMEIEKLKTIVYGEKTKDEVIQPVGEVTTAFSRVEEAFKNIGHAFEVTFAGRIQKLDENKIYYLAHPCTTGGKSIKENKSREEFLYQRIINENPGIRIIRPLQIIPEGMPHEEAMRRCFNMLDAAHAIILPLGWNQSNGCTQEHNRAEEKDIEKVYLNTN